MKRAVVEFKSNDKMVETRFNLRSSLRWIGFLFLAFLVVTFPVLAQTHEITLSLGGIPSQSRNFQGPGRGLDPNFLGRQFGVIRISARQLE